MIKDMSKFSRFTQKTTPYRHQDKEFASTWQKKIWGHLWEQGTGKTKTVIDTAAALFLAQEIDGLLVVAPKGSYRETWMDEFRAHMMEGLPYRVAVFNSTRYSIGRLPEVDKVLVAQDDMLDILLVNIEALSLENSLGVKVVHKFLLSHYAMMVVDESTYIKNPKAQRTKACIRLGQNADYRRILSGTPMTQGPLDVFTQCQFLQQGILGFRTYTEFKSYFAETVMIPAGNRSFPKIVGYRNLEQLTAKLQQFTTRVLKKDCLDLPPKVYQTQYLDMTPEQESFYCKIRDEAIIQLESGEQVTALNALTTINKLQQIACGHVKTDDGNLLTFPHNRTKTLIELLELLGPGHKVIIWCNYQQDVLNVLAALQEVGRKPVHYYGETSDDARRTNLRLFKESEDHNELVATPGCAGRSLTIVESDYSVYYSNGYNLEHRLQSEDRNHRAGQNKSVTYTDLVCRNTVDPKVLKRLKEKKQLADTVLDDYRELLFGSEPGLSVQS